MRVRIIKQFGSYRIGDTVEVSRNDAHSLIDGGIAVLSKDMTLGDYKTAQTRPVKAKRRK